MGGEVKKVVRKVKKELKPVSKVTNKFTGLDALGVASLGLTSGVGAVAGAGAVKQSGKLASAGIEKITGTKAKLEEARRLREQTQEAVEKDRVLSQNQAAQGRQAGTTGRLFTGRRGRKRGATGTGGASFNVSPSSGIQR